MTSIGWLLRDDDMPRTVYWQMFLDATQKIASAPRTGQDGKPRYDLFIPQEDLAAELNWPKYATTDVTRKADYKETNDLRSRTLSHHHKYIDGKGIVMRYINQILPWAQQNPDQRLWIVLAHSWYSLSIPLEKLKNVYYSQMNLQHHQRDINPNCFCWPLMPVTRGDRNQKAKKPRYLASFLGAQTHPVRKQLATIHNDKDILVKLVPGTKHKEIKLDSLEKRTDPEFTHLMQNSTFALVPRGDSTTSYRLTEALSFGTIPVIIADGGVLPFDRTVPWPDFSIQIAGDNITHIPGILRSISAARIEEMQRNLAYWFDKAFSSLEAMIQQALLEIEAIDLEREARK